MGLSTEFPDENGLNNQNNDEPDWLILSVVLGVGKLESFVGELIKPTFPVN